MTSFGAKDLKETPGGIAFSGTWETCYRANLWSRIASRILWRVADFSYRNEDELYAAAKAVDWPQYFAVKRKIRVNVTAQKSPLKSLEFATLKVKDAVCDRFRDRLGSRPDVDRASPEVRIHAFLGSGGDGARPRSRREALVRLREAGSLPFDVVAENEK